MPNSMSTRALIAICSFFLLGCGAPSIEDEQTSEPASTTPVEKETAQLDPERLFFIGQDLSAIRGYMSSQCCASPDGATAYLSIYRLLDGADFGGLGTNPDGNLLSPEASWGSGPVGARQTADEFGFKNIAIGLYLANEIENGLTRLLDGEFDDEITHLGKYIKSVDGTVYLRVGYEFDGAWNPGYHETETYIAAYRHIVDRLRNEDVSNVKFVWHASASPADDIIEEKHEDLSSWYPGDAYVDWMAISWFLEADLDRPAKDGYRPKTQRQMADELIALARTHGKPVLIAESSPQGFDIESRTRSNIGPIWDGPASENTIEVSDEDIWDIWYAPFFAYANENADVIKAIAYINVDWNSQPMWGPPYESGYWGDTRLETNEYIAARFSEAMTAWKQQ